LANKICKFHKKSPESNDFGDFYGNFVKLSLKSKEKPPILKKQAV